MTFWLRHKKVNVSADVCCSRALPWKIFFFHDVNFNYKQGLLACFRLQTLHYQTWCWPFKKKNGNEFQLLRERPQTVMQRKKAFFKKHTMVPLLLLARPPKDTYIRMFFILPRLWRWSHQTKISPITNRTKMWKAPYWFNHL